MAILYSGGDNEQPPVETGGCRTTDRAARAETGRAKEQALARILDLHTHTAVGSFDSRTTLAEIATLPARLPALGGLALTEHVHRWPDAALAQLPHDLIVFNEREFDIAAGHILVFGAPLVDRAAGVEQLREQVALAGGLMILAHPYRFYPSALSLLYPRQWHEPGEWPPERLAEHPLFGLVDAVEAWNARATRAQNELAEACAHLRGLPIVAGSDSHAPEDVGRYATEFEDEIATVRDLMAAIGANRCRPVELAADGSYRSLRSRARPRTLQESRAQQRSLASSRPREEEGR